MKRWVCVLSLLLLGACQEPALLYADGAKGDFVDWQGRWVAVNYWAEWCAPCRKEIPELNELHARPDVDVIGVNFDGLQGEKLSALIQTMDIEFPVLVADPRLQWDVEQPSLLPTTLLIDPKGQLASVRRGPQTMQDLLQAIAEHEGKVGADAVSGSGTP